MAVLDEALRYHRLGWSVFPIVPRTKFAPKGLAWKPFQTERPTEEQVRKWFTVLKWHGIAVVLGDVSGGLVCRDFDTMESYQQWAAAHPDLARTLPTVVTSRGRHVYFRANHRGIEPYADGELRGLGGICALPPSAHESGHRYRWIIPPPEDGQLPVVEDVDASGFRSSKRASCDREHREDGEYREDRRIQMRTDEMDSSARLSSIPCHPPSTTLAQDNLPEDVQRAILNTLPAGPGQRHRLVFDLARALKAIPSLSDADPRDLESIVRRWHDLALPYINTKPFEESMIDFLKGWPLVKFPTGTEPMAQIFATAKAALPNLPQHVNRYDQAALRLLVSLCRELQRAAGDGPFYLSCRTAGRLLEVDHTTANRWLYLLEQNRVLELVTKGTQATKQASRYRYILEGSPGAMLDKNTSTGNNPIDGQASTQENES